MSKITQYLNEHILGEATGNELVRKHFSQDGSLLSVIPEIVVHPRLTNDIRKVARFTWQLAEKGHVLPITVRGSGSDQTGGAIGKGIVINTLAHLNKIIYINQKGKDQFAHVQPGVTYGVLNETLKSHGLVVPSYPYSSSYKTLGGAVGNNYAGPLMAKSGKTEDFVRKLEVVLANGDLIETGRISKRDLDKKKGLQTFEGEIYRKIDGIIEDNEKTITDKITQSNRDNAGYSGIAKVKNRDGSFDLTPLFVGSQGTLGIVSEIVIGADFYNSEESVIVATFKDSMTARTAANTLLKLQPTMLYVLDGKLFDVAMTHGKKYIFSGVAAKDRVGAVLFVSYSDFNDRARRRKTKRTVKRLSKLETTIYSTNDYAVHEFDAIKEVNSVILQPDSKDESVVSIIDGASIPLNRIEEFAVAFDEFASKHHLDLPLSVDMLTGVLHTRPTLHLKQVSDKQKVFKLMTDYAELIKSFDGCLSVQSGEGRLKASAFYDVLDESLVDVYSQIRKVFDPYGTLNPGVKQGSDMKTLVSLLNHEHDSAKLSQYSPYN